MLSHHDCGGVRVHQYICGLCEGTHQVSSPCQEMVYQRIATLHEEGMRESWFEWSSHEWITVVKCIP